MVTNANVESVGRFKRLKTQHLHNGDNLKMKNVDQPEEFREELKKALKSFMEDNQQFNVQGNWTKDGLTVGVLVDFGIEDRDEGQGYVGSVSARYEDNYNLLSDEKAEKLKTLDCTPEKEKELREELKEKIAEHDAFTEAQNELYKAVNSVFDVPYQSMKAQPHGSDIDVSVTQGIDYGRWNTREKIEY